MGQLYRAPHTMIVVVAITIALGAVLLWALYSEQVAPPARRLVRRWTGVPETADIRRRDFPLAIAGYDPRAVDAHLRAVADAVAQLRNQIEEGRAADGPVQDGPAASAWSMAATPAAPTGPPAAEGSPWAPPGSVDEAQEGSRDDG